jgi:pilus assembly protein CpaF
MRCQRRGRRRLGEVDVDAVGTVEAEVRELIRRSGLDPARDTRELDRLVRDAVADYDERSLHGGLPTLPNVEDAVKSVIDAVAGFGPLQRYFDDPQIEEIWINEPTKTARMQYEGTFRKPASAGRDLLPHQP